MTGITPNDIRRAAMDLLARREHTQKELSDKLQLRFSRRSHAARPAHFHPRSPDFERQCDAPPTVDTEQLHLMIERELVRLAEENLQSDERFVESYINGKKSKGHGPLRIRREFSQKGVAQHLVDQYLDERDEQWLELAGVVYRKKFGEERPRDYREKARCLRFMQQRGFPVWMLDEVIAAGADCHSS